MSSSTSNSNQKRFIFWVLAMLIISGIVVDSYSWRGVEENLRIHQELAQAIGEDTDFLLVGDSKVTPFGMNCLQRQIPGKHGVVFSGDSVTPVYHYYMLRKAREAHPEFSPELVFVFVGANNMNANGLHATREHTFFNWLPMAEVWELSGAQGEYLLFAEAVLTRLLPVRGERAQITHLRFGKTKNHLCSDSLAGLPNTPVSVPELGYKREPIYDRNYYEIYRRSVYANYETSPMIATGFENLLVYIKEIGSSPVIVMAPVTPEMRELEKEMVGEEFNDTIYDIASRNDIEILDLRDEFEYEYKDVNHLTTRGAHDAILDHFQPIIAKYLDASTEE